MQQLYQKPRYLQGITLPPKGWVLALLLALYIFTGLIGHDPWKSDDAISIGVVYNMVASGNWLLFELAGQAYPDAPLYYWVAALCAQLFSWLLPFHDAARLASGLFTLLALSFILLACRELHGREHAAAAPLFLAGSVGFIFHAHEAQPMLAALAAHAAAYWALIMLERRGALSSLIYGLALASAFLAEGLIALLTLLPVSAIALSLSTNRRKSMLLVALGMAFAALVCLFWLHLLNTNSPAYLQAFLEQEWDSLAKPLNRFSNTIRYLSMLLWYAWPAAPLAAWLAWSKCRLLLQSRPLALPFLSFLSVWIILGLFVQIRSVTALLLLTPLVLLAAPSVAALRRGATNAFDWFSMMTFTLLAGFVWLGWSGMVFGWPERLAQRAVRLEPGFVGTFSLFHAIAAIAVSLAWIWMIFTTPKAPMRSIMHWMSGLTLFWFLVAMLWMPWIDYSKTYRPVSNTLAKVIENHPGCLANANLSSSVVASFDYFNDIRLTPLKSEEGARCNLMLVHGETSNFSEITAAGWKKIWEGKRPGDRKERERFHLFEREPKKKKVPPLPEIPVENPDIESVRP